MELNFMGADGKSWWKEPWGKDASVQPCMDLHEGDKDSNFHNDTDSFFF